MEKQTVSVTSLPTPAQCEARLAAMPSNKDARRYCATSTQRMAD
jgi:hypothetical protein